MSNRKTLAALGVATALLMPQISSARTLSLKDRVETAYLGAGYNVDADQVITSCLNESQFANNISENSIPKASSTVEMFKQISEVKKVLDMDIKGKGSIKKFFKGEGEYDLHKKLEGSKHSINFVVKIDIKTREERLKINNVNFLHNFYKEELNKRNKTTFINNCGHEVVTKLVYGGRLYSVLSVEFSSEEDKKDFIAKGNLSVGSFNFDGNLKSVFRQFSQKIQSKLYFYHHGGNPKKLYERLFLSTDEQDGKLALVECSMGEITKCYDLIHSIAKSKKDLLESIFTADGKPSYEIPLVAFTESYRTKSVIDAVKIDAELDRPEILAAKESIMAKALKYGKYLVEVSNILNSSLNLITNHQRKEFQTLKEEFENGMDNIKKDINHCYKDMATCADSDLYEELTAGQEQMLSIKEHRMSFEQICHSYMDRTLLNTSQHNLTENDRLDLYDSMEYLLLYIEGTLTYDDENADLRGSLYHARVANNMAKVCEISAQYLNRVEEVDFDKFHSTSEGKDVEKALYNFMPLAYLNKLKRLNISGQPVAVENLFNMNSNYQMLKRGENGWQIRNADFKTPFLLLKKLNITDTELTKEDFKNIGRRLKIKE